MKRRAVLFEAAQAAGAGLPWGLGRGGSRADALGRLAHLSTPPLIVGVWLLLVRGVRLREVTDVGLVSALPLGVFLLLGALTVSFALALRRRPLHPLLPLLHVLALVLLLYGLTAVVEPEPRFQTVWRHTGIMDYIATNESVDPKIDAYFSWPGFFALGVAITKIAGFGSPLAYANWVPLVVNLLCLPPLAVILRTASRDPRVMWFGLWLFYSTNWIGQDYLAPQAIGFLIWLSILATLLVWFTPLGRPADASALRRLPDLLRDPQVLRAAPSRLLRWWRRAPGESTPSAPAGLRLPLFLAALAMYAAIVCGHQLTPFVALVTVVGLTVFARLETRTVPLLMGVLLVVWIVYMTTAFLEGHIDVLTGPVGDVGGSVEANVGARLEGSAGHLLILHMRLLMTALIWVLAAGGFLRRLLVNRIDPALCVVGAAPFLLIGLQSYGGEVLLRIFLFSLPAMAFFIARLAFPSLAAGGGALTSGVVVALSLVLLGGFQYTRYGNERMDAFTPGDVAAVQALYRLAPRGSTLVGGTDNLPWRYRDYAGYEYVGMNNLSVWRARRVRPGALISAVQARLGDQKGYVIVTRSTEIGAELLDGKKNLLDRVVRRLGSWPGARRLYHTPDADIFLLPGRAESR